MSFKDYVILAFIAIAVFAAIRNSIRRRRTAGLCGGCCSTCAGCQANGKSK